MENVTEETIFNCWKKTGILPSSTNEDITNTRQNTVMNDEIENINEIIKELDVISDSYTALLADALIQVKMKLVKMILNKCKYKCL